jgi:hypothetical protein
MYGRYRHNGRDVLFPPNEPNWLWNVRMRQSLPQTRPYLDVGWTMLLISIMLYTFNNGALTWYSILLLGCSKAMLNSFQRHHNCLFDLRA